VEVERTAGRKTNVPKDKFEARRIITTVNGGMRVDPEGLDKNIKMVLPVARTLNLPTKGMDREYSDKRAKTKALSITETDAHEPTVHHDVAFRATRAVVGGYTVSIPHRRYVMPVQSKKKDSKEVSAYLALVNGVGHRNRRNNVRGTSDLRVKLRSIQAWSIVKGGEKTIIVKIPNLKSYATWPLCAILLDGAKAGRRSAKIHREKELYAVEIEAPTDIVAHLTREPNVTEHAKSVYTKQGQRSIGCAHSMFRGRKATRHVGVVLRRERALSKIKHPDSAAGLASSAAPDGLIRQNRVRKQVRGRAS